MVQVALFYPIIAIGAFAISSAMIKDLDRIGSPIYLNFLRATTGAVMFLLVIMINSSFSQVLELSPLILLYLVLSVFFNVVMGDTLYFYSQNTLGVKIATPIVNIYPFVTVLFSYLFLEESLSSDFYIGGVLIIGGVIILSQDVDENHHSDIDLHQHKRKVIIALIAAIGANICYALGVILITVGSEGIDVNVANAVRMPAASILLAFGVFSQYKFHTEGNPKIIKVQPREMSKKDIIKIILTGLLGTYLASYFLVLGTQKLGAGPTAILLSTGPLFSLPIAIFWLKEKLGWLTVIGTTLSISGLLIIIV